MIVNGYAVLDGFISLLRLVLGVLVVVLGLSAWGAWRRRAPGPEERSALEDRCYLLFSMGIALVALNVVAWPLFYLLLQSYVPEWPNVMCIYGVTRIGTGSLGPSRFLPLLVTALQLLKPSLLFMSGAWLVLYLVNRRTRTAPLTGRVLLLLLAAGLLAVADAGAEAAYLVIPKKEVFLSTGCCAEAFDGEARLGRFLPKVLVAEQAVPWLYLTWYAVNLSMVLGLAGTGRASRWRLPRAWLVPLLVGALAAVAVNGVFLVEVVAPRLLHLPYHHCPYDLVPQAPESLLAVALFLFGSFCAGWVCVAGWLANDLEARPFALGMIQRLSRLGALGYLWSVLMLSVELALA